MELIGRMISVFRRLSDVQFFCLVWSRWMPRMNNLPLWVGTFDITPLPLDGDFCVFLTKYVVPGEWFLTNILDKMSKSPPPPAPLFPPG